jgi:DNA-binding IclR family transcriptional regulator
MSSAERIIDLLSLFTLQRPTWTPLEVAERLGLSRATAFRYFAMLNETGYIIEVSGHRYALGPRIVELDRQIRLVDPLVQVAVDPMVELARRTGGAVLLCRLYGQRVLCVHQERGTRFPGHVSYERGRAMSLYMGATSKVILAFLSPSELKLVNVTSSAEVMPRGMPRDPARLHAYLAPIRDARVCVATGEVDPVRCGIAVPIFDHSHVIGSLSVVLVATEASERVLDATRRLVMDAGFSIEAALAGADEHASASRKRLA